MPSKFGGMKRKTIYLFVAAMIALAATSLVSCKHDIPVPLPVPPGGGGGTDTVIINPNPCDPGVVYFQNTILPILVSNCAQPDCHDVITHEEGIRLYSYATVMSSGVVTPGNPFDSDLYKAITEDDTDDIMPPLGEGSLTEEEKGLIFTWIQQGAQNNSCTPECNPAEFSFATNIAPVIDLTCSGCHSGTNPDGGLKLTNYSEISASALNGTLMDGLLGVNGIPKMPYNTAGLPQCNIEQIQAWINAGAPNN